MNCHICSKPIVDGARVRLTFEGFQSARLNGVTFKAHAGCIRMQIPDSELPLPPHIADPAADTDQVLVYLADGEWLAYCRDCGGVAQKIEVDDAHMAAARHIFRVHSGLAVLA